MADEIKLSPVEGIKETSRYLRGSLAEELANDSDHLSEEAKNLIKFHGSYQQEDRDARKNRPKGAAASKAYCFMIRLKLPGGKLTASQYLVMDELCEKYANSTLRFTTRQSIQFHGILKGDLKSTIAGFNAALVSSLGGCGDVNRNVMACPAPLPDPARKQMQDLADQVAEHLAPKSGMRAYHEIWLNGEKQPDPLALPVEVAEPIYGKVYLPRKFKIAFSLPNDNCTDILANCLGFLCITENGKPIGYNLYAAGGQGRSNSRDDTFAQPAACLGFVTPDEVIAASEAVIKMYRDHGNRVDRKRARFKYVLADWGYEKFREVFVRDYWKKPLAEAKVAPITGLDMHHGWYSQGDGRWFLGLSVENGRIKDEGTLRLRSGLREIVKLAGASVRISGQQDVLLCDIDPALKPKVDSLLNEYGIPRPENLSMVRKWSMACPAIPTCPLAITESERSLPKVVDQLEADLKELGLDGESISVRMTGCPNGCARPYQSEIGLVGRGGTKYTVFIGGDSFGRRLNAELEDSVPMEQIAPKMKKLFTRFKAERIAQEPFGDYCARLGLDALKTIVAS
ncbi:MAG: NADPH-dependent assimilatory sulfite reductase hemoprotein subunit [Fimbriiglobus sp.]